MENLRLCYNDFGHPCDVLNIEIENINKLKHNEVVVEMIQVPINPSDLIPISGAYRHRIVLPQVAGYEGVGKVISAGREKKHLIGKRVLPIREEGTWQKFKKCNTEWLIEVPQYIENSIASRAYINPLTAKLMLKNWSVNKKTVIITASGSFFSNFIIQWALKAGAKKVIGIYRNSKHVSRIIELGAKPISLNSKAELIDETLNADVCFDAVGGALANTILENLKAGKVFVSYGLLSRKPIIFIDGNAEIEIFHLRHSLAEMDVHEWKQCFFEIWNLLKETSIPEIQHFKFEDWRKAIKYFELSGREKKPVLQF